MPVTMQACLHVLPLPLMVVVVLLALPLLLLWLVGLCQRGQSLVAAMAFCQRVQLGLLIGVGLCLKASLLLLLQEVVHQQQENY